MDINNQNDIKQRVRYLIKEYRLTISDFATKIGISQPSLSRALAPDKPLGDVLINRIVITFRVNKSWLLTGEGEMFDPNIPQSEVRLDLGEEEISRLKKEIEELKNENTELKNKVISLQEKILKLIDK